MNDRWKLYESAFIKSIRRGLLDDAVYWGVRLYKLGRAAGVWRRMFIHLSEDIGPWERYLPATIAALHDNYRRLGEQPEFRAKTAYESDHVQRLPFVHAILLLASAKKTRMVDHAQIVHFHEPAEDRPVPDYALDFHSPKGRREGRDLEHFLKEGARLNTQPALWDDWESRAKEILQEKERSE